MDDLFTFWRFQGAQSSSHLGVAEVEVPEGLWVYWGQKALEVGEKETGA